MKIKITIHIFRIILTISFFFFIFITGFFLTLNDIDYKEKEINDDFTPTIDFIQPWYCYQWQEEEWDNLICQLKAQGYQALILQNGADIENNIIKTTYYQSNENLSFNCIETLLSSAYSNNFKVYLGLCGDPNWWNTDFYTYEQMEIWAQLNYEVAKDLYVNFKSSYSDTFMGYYFPFEMYSNDCGYEKYWAELINELIDSLNKIDNQMPLIFSPFNGCYNLPKNLNYDVWSSFFKKANLRSIDIFVPQDGFGGCDRDYQDDIAKRVNDFLQATYTACKNYSSCIYGVNIEFFTNQEKVYATPKRIERQLDIANCYGEVIVSFSYSHYYAKDT